MNTTTKENGHAKTKGRSLLVKPATVTEQPNEVEIHEIEFLTVDVTIVGKSQLIVNNFGEKSQQQMEDERALTKEEKMEIRKHGKPPITPAEIERRWQAARCLDSKNRDCVRAMWIKGALVTASKYPDIGVPSTRLRGILYVEGDLLPIHFVPRAASESDERVTYFGKGPGQARDVVRVGRPGAKQPDMRYRPVYDDWFVSFRLTFEPKLISLPVVYRLVRRAGTSVGLCEWRPEGKGGGAGGQFGRFDLKATS